MVEAGHRLFMLLQWAETPLPPQSQQTCGSTWGEEARPASGSSHVLKGSAHDPGFVPLKGGNKTCWLIASVTTSTLSHR